MCCACVGEEEMWDVCPGVLPVCLCTQKMPRLHSISTNYLLIVFVDARFDVISGARG